MSDETKIEPALSAEQWADVARQNGVGALYVDPIQGLIIADDNGYAEYAPLPVAIAVANAALPDSDPRKITREKIEHLKRVHWEWRQATRGRSDHESREEWAGRTWQLIQILESYLPPEGT